MSIELQGIRKAQAIRVLNTLAKQGVNVSMARRDLETRSKYYNIMYCDSMTQPIVTYGSD